VNDPKRILALPEPAPSTDTIVLTKSNQFGLIEANFSFQIFWR
jgi:hypothetical protein